MVEQKRPLLKPDTMDALREYKAKRGLTYDQAVQELLATAESVDRTKTTLHDRVDRLDEKLAEVGREHNETRNEVETLRDRVDETNDKMLTLVERLNTDYWETIVDEIEERT